MGKNVVGRFPQTSSAWVILLAAFVLVVPVGQAEANSDCDGRDRYLRANLLGLYRNGPHPVLRDTWHNGRYVLKRYPNCNMSYDEYYGLATKRSKKPDKAGARTQADTARERSPEEKVKVDPNPRWANLTKERILNGKQGEEVAVNLNPNRVAPYGSSECAEVTPMANRGKLDWDWVTVRNKCSYPIKVLTCYYDFGRASDCTPVGSLGSWGMVGVLNPGASTTSVATSQRWPWFVKKVVCDMREKPTLLCVLPK
ncbi:hypothetical protein NKY66_10965 [Sinorhizobium meliloti]|uniref:hypothetical protein n=1 Tax=Rhizobium meliloti TaxID=382 RepID=UPI003D655E9D